MHVAYVMSMHGIKSNAHRTTVHNKMHTSERTSGKKSAQNNENQRINGENE